MLEPALSLARTALAASPAGLLSDIDGTLAPIIADPRAVALADGAVDALKALSRRIAVVGLVTGRAAADVRRMGVADDLLVIGNHGLEVLEPGTERSLMPPGLEDVPDILARLLAAVPPEDGVMSEAKGLSATVHYRNAADPPAARRRIIGALSAALPDGIELREGRMSVELRPRASGDKGTALSDVVRRHDLRGLVVLGDDLTDLDMFAAAAALRAAGAIRAAILAVGADGEAPPAVLEAADASLASPADVVELLRALGNG